VTPGNVVVPVLALADAEVGPGAAGGQRLMVAPEQQLRPPNAANTVELGVTGVPLLFQRVGEGEVQGSRPELA
jgi:hypothetical protein